MEEIKSSPTEIVPPSQPISTPNAEKKNSKKKVGLIIGGITLLLMLIGIGTFYFLDTQQDKSLAVDDTDNLEMTESPSPTIVPTFSSSLPKEFKNRHFDITQNFWPENEKYPSEITQIPEESLTPTYCTPLFTKWGEKYTWSDETYKSFTLDDPILLKYIQILEQKYKSEEKSVSEIATCSPEEGKTIILYSLGPCGGGCSGLPHVGIVNGSEIKEIANISKREEAGTAYFGCRTPLQLTKNNIFYFQCGGGDGLESSASLFKLSLATETLSKIKSCSTTGSEDETGSKTECK